MSQSNGITERPKKDVALFLDFENVYISVRQVYKQNPNFEVIVEKAEEFGRVIISRAYADWYHYQRITNSLYANGIEPVYVPTYYYGQDPQHTNAIKNSVDIHLVIDAMRMLYSHDNIETFVFVTGDRDFIPLMNAIRQYGKECIVIGVAESASSHLAQSADEFYFYHQLAEDIASSSEQTKDPYEALVQAISRARERNSEPTFATLKLLMQEIMGSFDQSRYRNKSGKSFTKFKEFVKEAEERGKVQIFSNGTINMVFLPGDKPEEISQFAAEALEEKRTNDNESKEKTIRPRRGRRDRSNGRERSNGRDRSNGRERRASSNSVESKKEEVQEQAPVEEAKRTQAVEAVAAAPRKIEGPNDLIVEGINLARRRNNLCTMATLKMLMKEIQPDFDESKHKNSEGKSFAKFKDLVQQAVEAGEVQVLTTGTINEVFLADEDPQKLSRFANRRRR